jgi:hypothetical protein
MEIFGNKKTQKNPKNPKPNIIIKIYRDACKYTAYFQKWDPKKKVDLDSLAVFHFGHF